MSKIFEALRNAANNAKNGVQMARLDVTRVNGRRVTGRNQRRGGRRDLETIILAYGHTPQGEPFYEEARTINVSAQGALLELAVPVSVGQKLMLFNDSSNRHQICKIARTRVTETAAFEVAVEFPVPHAEFWQIFSPRDKKRLSETEEHEMAEAGVTA
jgi:hypothetical protein